MAHGINAVTSQQHMAIGVTSALLLLTTGVVFTRLYIRCILLKTGSAGWDDLTVFIAWVMAVGASIGTYLEIHAGLGRHIDTLTAQEKHNFGLFLFVVIQFYNVGLNTVKMSFLSQYHRIFPDRDIQRMCVWFGGFCFLWMFGQALLYSFSCVPISNLVPHMALVCMPTLPVWTAISSINVLTDLVIFSLPLRPLWAMPLLKRQKHLLMGIFGLGFLVCIISIIRIPTLRHGASSPDPTWTNVSTALWSLAELETAILCTSLPVLRPLVARFIRGLGPVPSGLRPGGGQPAADAADRKKEKKKRHDNNNNKDTRHNQQRGAGPGLLLGYHYATDITGTTLRGPATQVLSRTSTRDGNDDNANNNPTTAPVDEYFGAAGLMLLDRPPAHLESRLAGRPAGLLLTRPAACYVGGFRELRSPPDDDEECGGGLPLSPVGGGGGSSGSMWQDGAAHGSRRGSRETNVSRSTQTFLTWVQEQVDNDDDDYERQQQQQQQTTHLETGSSSSSGGGGELENGADADGGSSFVSEVDEIAVPSPLRMSPSQLQGTLGAGALGHQPSEAVPPPADLSGGRRAAGTSWLRLSVDASTSRLRS